MAVAYVRMNTPAGTIPDTFGATTTAGNQIYCMMFTNSTGSGSFTLSGVTTTLSNVLVSGQANFFDGHGDTYSLWAGLNAAGGAETFNVTQPSGANYLNSPELEFSGGLSTINALFTLTSNPGAGAGAVVGQSVTVANNDLLAVCCYDADAFGNPPTVNTAGSTSISSFNNVAVVYWTGTGAAIQPNFTAAAGDTATPHIVIQWIVSASPPVSSNSATVAWIT